MDEETQFLTLINLIYESTCNSLQWKSVLQHIADLTHSSSVILFYNDCTYPNTSFVCSHGISSEPFNDDLGNFFHQGLFVELLTRNITSGVVSADTQFVLNREELREIDIDLYEKILIKNDLHYIAATGLLNEGGCMAAITLQRKQAPGPWSNGDLDILSLLTPHLQRAFHIYHELTRPRIQENAVHAMLDQLFIGLTLMDTAARPLYINPTAQSLFRTHPALRIRDGKVSATGFEDARKLNKLIYSVSNPNHAVGEMRGGVLGLRHADRCLPLLVSVCPVSDLDESYQTPLDTARVAMFISDPEQNQSILPDTLITTFRLTRAEADVALALTNGTAPKEIANVKGISQETIRAQLKSIYRKTGTHSQAGLVRLLLTGPFGVMRQ